MVVSSWSCFPEHPDESESENHSIRAGCAQKIIAPSGTETHRARVCPRDSLVLSASWSCLHLPIIYLLGGLASNSGSRSIFDCGISGFLLKQPSLFYPVNSECQFLPPRSPLLLPHWSGAKSEAPRLPSLTHGLHPPCHIRTGKKPQVSKGEGAHLGLPRWLRTK